MALPKQRHTRERKNRARRELEMVPTRTTACPKCGAPVVPHRACSSCGEYRGRVAVKKNLPELGKKKRNEKAA